MTKKSVSPTSINRKIRSIFPVAALMLLFGATPAAIAAPSHVVGVMRNRAGGAIVFTDEAVQMCSDSLLAYAVADGGQTVLGCWQILDSATVLVNYADKTTYAYQIAAIHFSAWAIQHWHLKKPAPDAGM